MENGHDWRFFGNRVPKAEIVYICQIIIVYLIIITSIANLSLDNGNAELWISLLCSAIGYALPSPTLNHGLEKRFSHGDDSLPPNIEPSNGAQPSIAR